IDEELMGMLDEVRARAEAVSKSARFVKVQTDVIETYALALPLEQTRNATLDPQSHFVGAPDATLAFVLTLDAINFGSGYFPKLTKRPGLSGYFTVATSLKECYEGESPLSAERLQALNAIDCARIFGQTDNDEPAVAELMTLFSRALNDLGTYVLDRFGGSFRALVTAADSSAERLLAILAEMPFYQ